MCPDRAPRARVATLRLQLHAGFTFDDAAAVVPYLARLGISHVYTSPVLQAARGSTHGYDVVDPLRVNEELGGDDAQARFSAALQAHDMGWLLDIVPNHMEIGDPRNAWWWDVLENGRASAFASYFDIDWAPPEPKLNDVILVPILGDHRGRLLDRGEIKLERRGGFFLVRYYDHALPLSPRTLDVLLRDAADHAGLDDDARALLACLADAHEALLAVPPAVVGARHRNKGALRGVLARLLDENPRAAEAVDAAVARLNADPAALDALLERQSYRLAYWRTSERELDYRRFFDIDHLVAVRAEDPAVFAETHRLILAWAARGVIDGVRVDHVDGLADPRGYLTRLREALPPSSWIVVEKILEGDEALRADWPVDGTTGYDFLAALDAVFVDATGEDALTRLERRFTGEARAFDELAHEKRLLVLRDVLASDVARVTQLFVRLADGDRIMRDTTRYELREAICALAACLPVYRTYVVDGVAAPEDRAVLDEAVAEARRRHPQMDERLLAWLRDVLAGVGASGPAAREAQVRFQQLSGPAMAKGVEDTAFYAAHRLASSCEVGGAPGVFALRAGDFHARSARARERWPARLLASSTHDTKRSEDTRARISILSQVPERWAALVDELARAAAPHHHERVDRGAELELYQTLVGTWPWPGDDGDGGGGAYAGRVAAFMQKAAREAKERTSWTAPNADYEGALDRFVRAVIADPCTRALLAPLLAELVPAARVESLGKTLVKMTSPGVPDVYQGCDLFDESLVDPDNRRPVDWPRRARLLDDAVALARDPGGLLRRLHDGAAKLHVIRVAAALRRRRPAAFAGAYTPLTASRDDAVLAFARGDDHAVVVVVPRLALRVPLAAPRGAVRLPAATPRRYVNALTGDDVDADHTGDVDVRALLSRFPVALLVAGPSPSPGDGARDILAEDDA